MFTKQASDRFKALPAGADDPCGFCGSKPAMIHFDKSVIKLHEVSLCTECAHTNFVGSLHLTKAESEKLDELVEQIDSRAEQEASEEDRHQWEHPTAEEEEWGARGFSIERK